MSGINHNALTPGRVCAAERTAAIIVTSDRVLSGEKLNRAGETAAALLVDAGLSPESITLTVIGEGPDLVRPSLAAAVAAGRDIVVIIGGTGVGETNHTPEVSAEFIELRLTGLETQVLLAGLASSPKAGLSRGIIGLSARTNPTLIINTPGSRGGVADVLGVVLPLLPDIFREEC